MIGHAYKPRTDAELREEYEERAAIGQYERGMSRAESEREARMLVYGGVLEVDLFGIAEALTRGR